MRCSGSSTTHGFRTTRDASPGKGWLVFVLGERALQVSPRQDPPAGVRRAARPAAPGPRLHRHSQRSELLAVPGARLRPTTKVSSPSRCTPTWSASTTASRARSDRLTRLSRSNRARTSSALIGVAIDAVAVEHLGEQRRLAGLELHHLLLDGAGRHQPVDHHRPALPDPVRAVDGLRLDGGVPPRVEHEDVVGLGQGQPDSAGLEADQEHAGVALLEARRSPRPVAGAAVEVAST